MAFAESIRRRRASGLGVGLLLAVTALGGCGQQASTPAAVEAPAAVAAPPVVVVPKPVLKSIPDLGRNDIVNAAAIAASRFAAGQVEVGDDPLVGRNFVVRIPFGCFGPTADAVSPAALPAKRTTPAKPVTPEPSVADPGAEPRAGIAGWSWDAKAKVTRLRLEPAEWSTSAMFTTPEAAARWEAIEGFWIPRPWLASEACPKRDALAPQTGDRAATPQTVGLAAVFERGGSRLGRRDGRAYAYTIRAKGDEAPVAPAAGYQLVLAGRISAFPDGRAFQCRAAGPDLRPVCIAAIALDRVAFEAGGTVLTEWRPG